MHTHVRIYTYIHTNIYKERGNFMGAMSMKVRKYEKRTEKTIHFYISFIAKKFFSLYYIYIENQTNVKVFSSLSKFSFVPSLLRRCLFLFCSCHILHFDNLFFKKVQNKFVFGDDCRSKPTHVYPNIDQRCGV